MIFFMNFKVFVARIDRVLSVAEPFHHPLFTLTFYKSIDWIHLNISQFDGNICPACICNTLQKSSVLPFPHQLGEQKKNQKGKALFPMQTYAPLTHIFLRSQKKSNFPTEADFSCLLMLMTFIIISISAMVDFDRC